MQTAIYLRVSSKQQDTASQEADLKRYAAAHADEEIVWYRDKFTGKTMDRPGWNKLAAAMHAGTVSKVVCWRLDRLGRTAKGLTALFAELTERRVNLVSLRDGIDLLTPSGRLMANVLASVAQFETEIRAERVRAGQEAARAKGKRWGGSKAGWHRADVLPQVHAARDMHASGKPIAEIARVLKISRPTVYRILSRTPA